jgi:hypothetical protein
MHNLPIGTPLGILTIQTVIEYYDFPRLFVCRSNLGQSYFALSVADNDESFDWLYLAVSESRKYAILQGQLPLAIAFKTPESGFVFQVVTYASDKVPFVNYLIPEQISSDDLPDQEYVLSVTIHENELQLTRPRARDIAVATRREIFDYRIFPGRQDIHEVSARKLGGILTVTQELVDALGQASKGEPTIRGPISGEILQRTRLQVSHTFPGSFGVQFLAAEFSDLLNHSLVSQALAEFSNIILAKNSEDLLSNKLHSLRGRVTSKYRRLLKELADLNSGISFEWGSVNPSMGGTFEMTPEEVRSAYAIVDRMEIAMAEEMTISGKLIGFNSRTRRYEIMSSNDGRTYSGKVADDVNLEVQNPAIGEFYEVDLRMLIETQSTSGDELIRWILVRLGTVHQSNGA